MLHKIIQSADRLIATPAAQAHCDIPCKIYDPITAQIAALSVIRLIDIMTEEQAKGGDATSLERVNTIARCVMRKEEEAEKVKHEVRIIWGDYFKAPQMEAHPQINDLTHQIMLKGGACKQGTDRANAEALLELVNQFAEIFWTTKGVQTERKVSPYPPAEPVAYPVL